MVAADSTLLVYDELFQSLRHDQNRNEMNRIRKRKAEFTLSSPNKSRLTKRYLTKKQIYGAE